MSTYIHFTEDQKNRANSVDLVEFLQIRGEKLMPSGKDKRLESNKSITIRGNEWFDHATEKGGLAIDFVQNFYSYSFPQSVSLLLGSEQGEVYKPAVKKQEQIERKEFVLPEANTDMRRVYAYLLKQRFIDRDVLTHFARAKTIYEDSKHHNAVFIGCDENGVPCHAHKKSTHTIGESFRGNVEGCNRSYSFHHNGTSEKLYVFEAPIDMLSFISLYMKDWQQHSYVALCGVPEHTMLKMLQLNSHLQNVILCLDHDVAGIESTQRLADILNERGYNNVGILQSEYKDWNEDIKAKHGLEPIFAEEHPQLIICDEICSDLPITMQEYRNVNCSLQKLQNLFDSCRIHQCSGRFEQAEEYLKKLSVLSLLAAKKQYSQMEQSVTNEQLAQKLRRKFRPYQNKCKFQTRMTEIQQSLTTILCKQGVITQAEKEQLAQNFESVALQCVNTLVTVEVESQKLIANEVPEMEMTI